VQHWIRRTYIYWFIPTGKTPSYTITLRSGEQVKVTSSFRKVVSLGDTIQRMWAQADLATRAQQQS
jgi:hypothetical protein